MSVGGSQQLRMFRRAIRDGALIEDAAAAGDMSIGEARLHYADDLKNPPPPEAYALLGHNSGENDMSDIPVAADELRLLIERIERLEEEKKGIADDIKDVYAEAKSRGFDVKTMRTCVKLRKMEKHNRDEAEMLLDTYKQALGLDYSATPLGAATIRTAMERTVDAVNAGALGANVTASIVPAGGNENDLYPAAVSLVREHDKASPSWLQRQLRIGYNQAARLIERMETEGVVSRPDHVGRREVVSEAIAAE